MHASHSTARVLTSEFVDGRRFADVLAARRRRRASRYGEILFRFVFGSIVRHGMFNGDPHPGNYLFDDDGRVVFLDFGCVKYFPPDMLTNWRALVTAHLAGDRAAFARQLVALDLPAVDATASISTCCSTTSATSTSRSTRTAMFDVHARVQRASRFKQVFKPDGSAPGCRRSSTCRATSSS